jgi:uncharacterized membrane protein YgdD (TMEM256/DUF423 family)
MNIARALIIFAGLSGALAVGLGAWLAHGGAAMDVASRAQLYTALDYQLIHTLALCGCVLFYLKLKDSIALFSGCAFAAGILLFSGNIYLKKLVAVYTFAQLTPVGGICFIIGWLLLALLGRKFK